MCCTSTCPPPSKRSCSRTEMPMEMCRCVFPAKQEAPLNHPVSMCVVAPSSVRVLKLCESAGERNRVNPIFLVAVVSNVHRAALCTPAVMSCVHHAVWCTPVCYYRPVFARFHPCFGDRCPRLKRRSCCTTPSATSCVWPRARGGTMGGSRPSFTFSGESFQSMHAPTPSLSLSFTSMPRSSVQALIRVSRVARMKSSRSGAVVLQCLSAKH